MLFWECTSAQILNLYLQAHFTNLLTGADDRTHTQNTRLLVVKKTKGRFI